jgi:hypothetical protein
VQADAPAEIAEELHFPTTPFAVPLEVSQAVARHLAIAPDQLCLVADEQGAWLFHFWGDLYSALLAGILQHHLQGDEETTLVTVQNELCLHLPTSLGQLPPWNQAVAENQLHILLPRLEALLELGRFHSLLPVTLAEQALIAHCDLPRFQQLYENATLAISSAGLRTQLLTLVR